MHKRLILTAASRAYEQSLLALLGSLDVNWPGHPDVLVYDLGMSPPILKTLHSANITVRTVPPYCDHWRKHFTWKVWCCKDAPCDSYLWLDAGVCVLAPIDEAFDMAEKIGYFCQPNGFTLELITPPYLSRNCNITPDELKGLLSINGGLHGLLKDHKGRSLLEEAHLLSLDEQNMRATMPLHRHDQALLSILFYKYFKHILFADHLLYAGYNNATEINGQKLWVHRRKMSAEDMEYFTSHIGNTKNGLERIPSPPPPKSTPPMMLKFRIFIAQLRGRHPVVKNVIPDGVRD